jgi:hypothetical protein
MNALQDIHYTYPSPPKSGQVQRGRPSTKSLLDSSKAKSKSQKVCVCLRKGALCSATGEGGSTIEKARLGEYNV